MIISPILRFDYQEFELTGASPPASPFVDLSYSPETLYHQKPFQNMFQAPPHDNNYHTQSVIIILQHPNLEPESPCRVTTPDYSLTKATISKQGNNSPKAPCPSLQITTFNSCAPPASSIGPIGPSTTNHTSFPRGLHDVAPSYSVPTHKLHGSLAPSVEHAGYYQTSTVQPSSAMTTSTRPPVLQFNMETHKLPSPLMSAPLSFAHPNPFMTAMYPTFPPTMQYPSNFTTVTHPLSQNGLLSGSEQSSTIFANHPPACLPLSQWDPLQPVVPSPPSTNPSTNPQLQLQRAERTRVAHCTSASAGDCQPLSPRLIRYRRPQKKQPAVEFEPDIKKLQGRCREAGGDEQAVLLIKRVFVDEVNLASLTRKLSAKELASHHFGSEAGQVYVGFLRAERNARYACRLCPRDTEMSWKHKRDVLRHLRRDHFGLAEKCHWYVSFRSLVEVVLHIHFLLSGKLVYTTGEMRSHRCRKMSKS